ncbi:hypothetical protein KIH23_10115 [Flavobacterium sp. CYK-55]|uniref:hypothetical protein n=1 Tax=Flavobacterium sp. CYK-55 TaxID=2835529 RepID=UPI001BCE23BF|nr:hypothetical protein [Flavobacterium sp. CYK-55]MBS7787652.1 hypothetical protein [Flavobacterium sp. CYK-55]
MSRKVSIFQTLENRDNPDYVEYNGPFICKWTNAWLGTGYYFWEAFVENAHWWGKSHLNGNYMICEANCCLNENEYFDLVGDTTHMKFFHETVLEMKKQGLINKKTTVSKILQHMRDVSKVLKVDAVRAFGIHSISEHLHPKNIFRMLFEPNKKQYLDFKPPIQICFFKKSGLNMCGYRVIYPDEFNNNYVV